VLCLVKLIIPTPEEIQAYWDDPFRDETRPLTEADFSQDWVDWNE